MTQPNIIVNLRYKNSKENLGSAVAVASDKVLTATHVIKPGGNELPVSDYEATLLGYRESLSVKEIRHYPDRDISLITLCLEHRKTVVTCDFESRMEEGLEVQLLACNTQENCIKGPFNVQLINRTEPDGWEFHTLPTHGMSGGAVLLDGKLVGIIQAKDEKENSGIVIPLSVIKVFLYEHLNFSDSVSTVVVEPSLSKLPVKHYSELLEQIKENISKELKRPEVLVFTQSLRKQLVKIQAAMGIATRIEEDIDEVTNMLIHVMEHGGDGVPVINQALSEATKSCFDRLHGSNFRETLEHHEVIADSIEQLLGWLVLVSLDKTIIDDIRPETGILPAIFFELPIETAGGVEAIVSYQYGRAAAFRSGVKDMRGKHMLSEKYGNISWYDAETINSLKLNLWNKVFDENRRAPPLSVTETRTLNSRLKNNRENALNPEHYYLAIQCDKVQNGDDFSKVYKKLLKELDNLTLVHFGWGADQDYFCTYEHDLMDAINLFLNNMKKIRAI